MGWLGELMIIAVVVMVALPIIGLWMRRRWLSNRGGVFDCSLRKDERTGWMLGMARYEADTLEWYRVFSVTLRPKVVLPRDTVDVVERRLPGEAESALLFQFSEVVKLRVAGTETRTVELAMAPESVMGLMSWIEAGPRSGLRYPGGE